MDSRDTAPLKTTEIKVTTLIVSKKSLKLLIDLRFLSCLRKVCYTDSLIDLSQRKRSKEE